MALIAIHGYYGYGNLGDDLMLYLLIEQLRRLAPEAGYRVLHKPDADPSLIESPVGASLDCRAVSTWRERFAAVHGADVLIFGGGTCLHRFGYCGLYNNLAARMRGVPVIWLGVGADDVGTGKSRWKAKLALRTCQQASWRDEPSMQLASELAPRFQSSLVAEDLAFLIADSPAFDQSSANHTRDPAAESSGDPPIVVGWRCLRGYLSGSERQRAMKHGVESIRRIATQQQASVQVIDVADLIDNQANAELTRGLRAAGVNAVHREGLSMLEKVDAIRSARGCVFARLHGLVLAQLYGVPSVAVSYAAKLDNFGQLFEQPPVIGLRRLLDDEIELAEAFAAQRSAPARWKHSREQHVANARKHLALLKPYLPAAAVSASTPSTRDAA